MTSENKRIVASRLGRAGVLEELESLAAKVPELESRRFNQPLQRISINAGSVVSDLQQCGRRMAEFLGITRTVVVSFSVAPLGHAGTVELDPRAAAVFIEIDSALKGSPQSLPGVVAHQLSRWWLNDRRVGLSGDIAAGVAADLAAVRLGLGLQLLHSYGVGPRSSEPIHGFVEYRDIIYAHVVVNRLLGIESSPSDLPPRARDLLGRMKLADPAHLDFVCGEKPWAALQDEIDDERESLVGWCDSCEAAARRMCEAVVAIVDEQRRLSEKMRVSEGGGAIASESHRLRAIRAMAHIGVAHHGVSALRDLHRSCCISSEVFDLLSDGRIQKNDGVTVGCPLCSRPVAPASESRERGTCCECGSVVTLRSPLSRLRQVLLRLVLLPRGRNAAAMSRG